MGDKRKVKKRNRDIEIEKRRWINLRRCRKTGEERWKRGKGRSEENCGRGIRGAGEGERWERDGIERRSEKYQKETQGGEKRRDEQKEEENRSIVQCVEMVCKSG